MIPFFCFIIHQVEYHKFKYKLWSPYSNPFTISVTHMSYVQISPIFYCNLVGILENFQNVLFYLVSIFLKRLISHLCLLYVTKNDISIFD